MWRLFKHGWEPSLYVWNNISYASYYNDTKEIVLIDEDIHDTCDKCGTIDNSNDVFYKKHYILYFIF